VNPLTGHETGSGYTAGTGGLIRAIKTVGHSITTLPGVNTTPISTAELASCTADCSYDPPSICTVHVCATQILDGTQLSAYLHMLIPPMHSAFINKNVNKYFTKII